MIARVESAVEAVAVGAKVSWTAVIELAVTISTKSSTTSSSESTTRTNLNTVESTKTAKIAVIRGSGGMRG
jgi:hypothetical protein